MTQVRADYESVAVSSRIRFARNFKDYPFPSRLLRDAHAIEQASEITHLVAAELMNLEKFRLYEMDGIGEDEAALLCERNLISKDLLRNRRISAAVVSEDGSISVMINEEDHIREQYFMKGYDLRRAFERLSGIDDIISDSIPFAYDSELGFLTACPTNLGTGMRASVMLFLPALARRGLMRRILPTLTRLGLTVRGVFGEGSGSEGDLFQISNEITLGLSEEEILFGVEQAVSVIVETELLERSRMKAEEGVRLKDEIYRSYGILTCCGLLSEKELYRRVADLKLGVALGFFGENADMGALDALSVSMRPASLNALSKQKLSEREAEIFRAEKVGVAVRAMDLAIK